jgi:hypothetical protein
MNWRANRKAIASESPLTARKKYTQYCAVTCPPDLSFEAVSRNDPRIRDLSSALGNITGRLPFASDSVE